MKSAYRRVLPALSVWLAVLPVTASPTPEDVAEILGRADQARAAQRLEEAAELYRQAAELDAQSRHAWWYLSTVLYDLKRYEEARDTAMVMISNWPKYGPGYAVLGLSLFYLGDYGRALANFQQARIFGIGKNESLQTVVRYHGALALNRLGEFEAAYQAIKGFAYTGEPIPGVLDTFGLCMLRLPYLPWEIPAELREIVRRVGRATFTWESGLRDEAKALFSKVLQEYPRQPHLHYSYGAILLISDPDSALQLFLQELELDPTHHFALVQVALEYIRRGEFETARPYAERAVKADPSSFAGRFALGQVLLETGSPEEAVPLLEEAAALAPSKPEVHFVLGRAYQRMGRREDAQREYQEFERLSALLKEAEQFLTRQDYSTGSGNEAEAKP